MLIYEKRGTWYLSVPGEDIKTFPSEEAAKASLGFKDPAKDCNDESCDQDPCECEEEAKNGKKEEESGKEKASPNKQKTVLSSKGSSKKKV